MKAYKLKDLLNAARDGDYALGHFNFGDSVVLRAIVGACENLRSPIFVGTSEGEANFIGYARAVALVRATREEVDIPIFLNADHHKTFEAAKSAIDAGYDSVQIDEMALSLEENISITKQIVNYAKTKNSDISVEGGIGYIRGSSEVHREIIEVKREDMTSPEEAQRFVEETGVDRLAVVVGNIHGISLKGNPRLDLARLSEIHKALPDIPLTLHGGSGISDEDFIGCLPFGMSNIHINTEIRIAFQQALKEYVMSHPEETTPYKFFSPAYEAAREVIEKRVRLFRAVNIV